MRQLQIAVLRIAPLFFKQIIFRFSNKKYSSFVFAAAGLFYVGIAVGENQSFFWHCSRFAERPATTMYRLNA